MSGGTNRIRLSKAERRRVYEKMRGHCAYCGQEIRLEDMQVDHIVSLRKGGADATENMFPACRSCNHYKSTLSVEQFRELVQRIPDTLLRDSVTFKNGSRFGVVQVSRAPVVFYFEEMEKVGASKFGTDLHDVPTCELVKELQKREGVETHAAEPYQDVAISVNGPAVVLVVID